MSFGQIRKMDDETALFVRFKPCRIDVDHCRPGLLFWNIAAPARFAAPVQGIIGQVDSVAVSPDGVLLAIGGHDGVIRLWDTVSEQIRVPVLQGHRGPVYGLIFRDKRLYSGGGDGRILVW